MTINSKQVSKEKHSKEALSREKDIEDKSETIQNPQKKRLEQLRKRREQEAALREKHGKKSRSKATSRETAVKPSREEVKMSAEVVDCEYDVEEEDPHDEQIRDAKNETVKELLIKKKAFEKALRLATENERKLNSIQEVMGAWFDKYDLMIDDLEAQLTGYDLRNTQTKSSLLENAQPVAEDWKKCRESMQDMKFVGLSFSSATIMGSLAHYGILLARKLLYAIAYCKDAISAIDSPRNSKTSVSPQTA